MCPYKAKRPKEFTLTEWICVQFLHYVYLRRHAGKCTCGN